jgi:hypothetical protein
MLLAALAIGALISTATQMAAAIGRYRDSLETGRLAAADKIFQGVLALRTHRSDVQSALIGEDDPRSRLTELEKIQRAAYQAIAALDRVVFDGRDALASSLRQRWYDAGPKFRLLADQAASARRAQPRANQPLV